MENVKWEGVYPAVTTKFFQNQDLDIEGFKNGIKLQLDAKVHGIIICGSLGENGLLSTAEKLSLISAAKESIGTTVPLIMTIAECSTPDAMSLAVEAGKLGANGFMLLPPMRYHADDRETLHYMHKVADAGQLPTMIYNNPVAYKNFVSLDMFEDLGKNPLFTATKESTGDIRFMTDLINRFSDRFKIMSGVDDLAMESLVMGAHGWIAGLVCAFPHETVAIYELIKLNRIAEAREIYRWFFPLLHLDIGAKFVHNIKLAEAIAGTGTEWIREPRLPLQGDERQKVIDIVESGIKNRPILPKF